MEGSQGQHELVGNRFVWCQPLRHQAVVTHGDPSGFTKPYCRLQRKKFSHSQTVGGSPNEAFLREKYNNNVHAHVTIEGFVLAPMRSLTCTPYGQAEYAKRANTLENADGTIAELNPSSSGLLRKQHVQQTSVEYSAGARHI
jgi:hypothetical protein